MIGLLIDIINFSWDVVFCKIIFVGLIVFGFYLIL